MPFRCLIIAGFIFFSGGFAIAQPQKNDVYIRTNLLSLIDPFAAGPTIGAEYFLTDHVSLGTDVGIILYNLQRQKSDNMGKPYGYKIKPERCCSTQLSQPHTLCHPLPNRSTPIPSQYNEQGQSKLTRPCSQVCLAKKVKPKQT